MTARSIASCGYVACNHRAVGNCDCSWQEFENWPAGELQELMNNTPGLLAQAVKDAALADAALLDHRLTLHALEQLLEKALDPDSMKTEIRAIIETAINPQQENENAAELR